MGIGFVSVLFGIVGFVRGKVPLTADEVLTGSSAKIASGATIIVGFALIGLGVILLRLLPG